MYFCASAPKTITMTNEIKCPKCGSTQLSANKKGFSGAKAVGGALLTGGIGVFAGTLGSNKVIITCMACGQQFKPGEDYDSMTKKKQQQAEAMKSPGFWIFFFVMIGVLIWGISKCSDSEKPQSENKTISVPIPEPEKVNFETFEEWNISGGKGKLIVIEANQTNIETLKQLGERLNYDSQYDQFALIMVFNSKKAAGMYRSLSSLNSKDGAYYDKHFVATYHKNLKSGLNTMQITVNGLGGKSIEVEYNNPSN